MSKESASVGEIIGRINAPLTPEELQHISNQSIAITHAIGVAREAPATLSTRTRAMVLEKLLEAEHWLLETVRESSR